MSLLEVSAEIGPFLLALQRHCAVAAPQLTAVAVAEAEKELGMRIPRDVLGVLAASGRPPSTLVELLREIETLFTTQQGRRAPFHHVPFVAWSEWPRGYGCVDAQGRYSLFYAKLMTFEPTTLTELVVRIWPQMGPAAHDTPFRFELIGDGPSGPRKVVHPTFGTGTVLSELDGKLTIDFGTHGTKTLLARFVKEL